MKKNIFILLLLLTLSTVLYVNAQLTDDTPATPNTQYFCPNLTTTFQKGSKDLNTNNQVSDLQFFLVDYFILSATQLPVTGFFGTLTTTYLKQFQIEKNLPAFGIVGTLTRAKISAICTGIVTPPATQSCSLNGETIQHGATILKYQSLSVVYPTTCKQEVRTCDNGILTGSYLNTSCSVAQPQINLSNRLVTNLHRQDNVNTTESGLMFGGWGPHLGHLLRDTLGGLWFVDDTGTDVNINAGINYYKFNPQSSNWSLLHNNVLYGKVQQNMGSIINNSNVIMTYGVDIQNSKIEECYLVVTNGQKACNLVINIPLGVNPNYIGAIISPNGQTRLVWWTNQINGSGKFSYAFNTNYAGWNGPFTTNLGSYNDLAYVNAQFTNENTFHIIGQGLTGVSTLDWVTSTLYGSTTLGNSITTKTVPTTGTNITQSTPNDLYVDSYGGKHILLRTTNSSPKIYYVYINTNDIASTPILIEDGSYSRFIVTDTKISVVNALLGGGVKIRTKNISSVSEQIDWTTAQTQTYLSEVFDGIYPESKNYQYSPVTGLNFTLNKQAIQNEILQVTE